MKITKTARLIMSGAVAVALLAASALPAAASRNGRREARATAGVGGRPRGRRRSTPSTPPSCSTRTSSWCARCRDRTGTTTSTTTTHQLLVCRRDQADPPHRRRPPALRRQGSQPAAGDQLAAGRPDRLHRRGLEPPAVRAATSLRSAKSPAPARTGSSSPTAKASSTTPTRRSLSPRPTWCSCATRISWPARSTSSASAVCRALCSTSWEATRTSRRPGSSRASLAINSTPIGGFQIFSYTPTRTDWYGVVVTLPGTAGQVTMIRETVD